MFGRSLAANLEMHLGRTGANDTMLRLCEEAFLAFDWHHLALRTPTREHYFDVLRLVELLEPMLRRTLWPPAPAFPHVRRAWPAQRGANGWFRQFQLLALRVRNKAKDPQWCRRWGWWRTECWFVCAVTRVAVEASLAPPGSQLGRSLSEVARCHTCRLIGEFAGLLGVSAGSRGTFRASTRWSLFVCR